jgi:hypothetical protein
MPTISKAKCDELDKAMLFALAALGDTDSALELGHFGNMTHKEAVIRLKQARKDLELARPTST